MRGRLHKKAVKIPFSVEEFFAVFTRYNEAVWPLQVMLFALAVFALLSVVRKSRYANIIAFSFLSFLWIWMGAVYHLAFFSRINGLANVFGGLFTFQGLIFLYYGVWHQRIKLERARDVSNALAYVFIAYALVFYPLLGIVAGHAYPSTPTFGVPCPTTIYTFGILLFAKERIPWFVVIMPFLWSLVGFSAALNLSVPEDFGLVVAGVVSTVVVVFLKPRRNAEPGLAV